MKIEEEKVKMQLWVLKLMAMTLGSIMVSTVLVMLVGLFMPNNLIDNAEIFKILGPAFNMVVGAFVGSFATMMGMKTDSFNPNMPKTEAKPATAAPADEDSEED